MAYYVNHWLRVAHHRPQYFARGIDLVVAAQKETFDVPLLDWNVPGLSRMDIACVTA
jgi:DNA-binding response OmpR family regulator